MELTNESLPLFPNPLLEISDFDSDSTQPMSLCVVPSAAGEIRLAVPAAYIDLVNEFDGKRTVHEAISAFLDKRPDGYSRTWLQRLVEESLIRKGILVNATQDPARVAVSNQPKWAFLHIKVPIIKPRFVDPIARALSFMFSREALILSLILIVATHVYAYAVAVPQSDVSLNDLDVVSFVLLMVLSSLGTICHEFGHASAAARYGCKNMEIGWGVYIIYTVLWTNLSEAWKLPRHQRVLVDAGGIYFQSFFQIAMLLVYVYTGDALYLLAYISVDLGLAKNFNPFLRMDGYWVMSDLFGIVNLRKQQVIWIRSLIARLSGDRAPIESGGLSKKARIALGVYTVLGTLFLVYIVNIIFQVAILDVLLRYPDMVVQFWHDLRAGMPFWDLITRVTELGWRAVILLGTGIAVVNLFKRGSGLVGTVRAAAQRAAARGAA